MTIIQTTTTGTAVRFAGLRGERWGRNDHCPPLLLLHGLTSDRTMWRGIVAELEEIDPDRRVVSLDLPGLGESPDQRSYDLPVLAAEVYAAAEQAGLAAPVVGHSVAAGIASVYAANYPTSGVVNMDGSPVLAPIAQLLRSVADRLRGPEFAAAWQPFWDSFHVELLPPEAAQLVEATCRPHQQVALGYWRGLMEDPIEDLMALIARSSAAIAHAGVSYIYLAGADLDPDTRAWLDGQPFTPTVEVWPGSGHFPHLAHPARFAARLAAFALPRPR